jgi:hypothetical protein
LHQKEENKVGQGKPVFDRLTSGLEVLPVLFVYGVVCSLLPADATAVAALENRTKSL